MDLPSFGITNQIYLLASFSNISFVGNLYKIIVCSGEAFISSLLISSDYVNTISKKYQLILIESLKNQNLLENLI